MSDGDDSITVRFALTAVPSASRVSCTVKKDVTADGLRAAASEATKIPLGSLRLIFRGRIVQPNNEVSALTAYNLENDSVVHCLGRPDPEAAAAAVSAAPVVAASTVTAPTTAAPAPAVAPAVLSLDEALARLRARHAGAVRTTALTTLAKMVSNVLNNPNEERYRRVKTSNAAFSRRLGGIEGGRDAMRALGFVEEDVDGEPHLVLNASAEAWTKLNEAKVKIDAEVTRDRNENAAPPSFAASDGGSPFGAGAGVGPSPNLGGGLPGFPTPPPGGLPPAMQQQLSNMMSDPNAMRDMLSNPLVRQVMQSDPRVANNPMLQRALDDPNMMDQITRMMSDPAMRQLMSNPALMQGVMNAPGGMDPAAMSRMMQTFSQTPPGGAGVAPSANTDTNTNNTGASSSSSSTTQQQQQQGDGERELTEEEMIAEAIARSLRDP